MIFCGNFGKENVEKNLRIEKFWKKVMKFIETKKKFLQGG